MAPDPQTPVFLERSRYRARRWIDGLRLLPWIGVLAFILPALLLPLGEMGRFSNVVTYFFAAWAGLIAVCAILSVRVSRGGEGTEGRPAEDDR